MINKCGREINLVGNHHHQQHHHHRQDDRGTSESCATHHATPLDTGRALVHVLRWSTWSASIVCWLEQRVKRAVRKSTTRRRWRRKSSIHSPIGSARDHAADILARHCVPINGQSSGLLCMGWWPRSAEVANMGGQQWQAQYWCACSPCMPIGSHTMDGQKPSVSECLLPDRPFRLFRSTWHLDHRIEGGAHSLAHWP